MGRPDGAGQPIAGGSYRGSLTVVAAALALGAGAGPAVAHQGDAAMVHSCIVPSSGYAQIVGPDDACAKNARALDWSAVDTNTTYSAGSGLSLTGTEFSVIGAPWSGLTGVPADLRDGDDDGSAGLTQLRAELEADDGIPNETADLVSFTKLKDLDSPAGGRILGSFIQDGTIRSEDVGAGQVQSTDLAGEYTHSHLGTTETVAGAVTGEKIRDATIEGRDLGPVVAVATRAVDPLVVAAGTREAVTFAVAGVRAFDLVTVSPPAVLEPGLVFAGSDVLSDGQVTVYLHNVTAGDIDASPATWTVRWLDTGP